MTGHEPERPRHVPLAVDAGEYKNGGFHPITSKLFVILRCALLRASKDDKPGPSPFEARFARTSG
jgi:hypothetical protein